jgi:hypothetical protein
MWRRQVPEVQPWGPPTHASLATDGDIAIATRSRELCGIKSKMFITLSSVNRPKLIGCDRTGPPLSQPLAVPVPTAPLFLFKLNPSSYLPPLALSPARSAPAPSNRPLIFCFSSGECGASFAKYRIEARVFAHRISLHLKTNLSLSRLAAPPLPSVSSSSQRSAVSSPAPQPSSACAVPPPASPSLPPSLTAESTESSLFTIGAGLKKLGPVHLPTAASATEQKRPWQGVTPFRRLPLPHAA